jgi:hypothetical protein
MNITGVIHSTPATEMPAVHSHADTSTPKDQQRVVVGATAYAFHSARLIGTATGFGAQFSVRFSQDGSNYTTLYEVAAGGSTTALDLTFHFPGYYRVVATNPATLFSTYVVVNIFPS